MIKYTLQIEDVLKCIRREALQQDVDLLIEPVHNDSERQQYAAFIQNTDTGRFGILCTNLEDTDPDILHHMLFCPKMYEYATMEGFNRKECFEAFSDDILKSCSEGEFIEFILEEKTY